jgi:hypothetical protein
MTPPRIFSLDSDADPVGRATKGIEMRTSSRRAKTWVAGLAVLAAMLVCGTAQAQVSVAPPARLESGLVGLLPGETLVVRARVSEAALSSVATSFYDDQDTLVASFTQTVAPGQPYKARFNQESLPGTVGVKAGWVRVVVTPLETANSTEDDGTSVTMEALQGTAHARLITVLKKGPLPGGGGRDTALGFFPQLDGGWGW